MQQTFRAIKGELPSLLAAMTLGAGLGLFVHGYWLIDIFPVGSRQLLFFTIAICLLGLAGYYLLLKWMQARLILFSGLQRSGLLGWSLLLGTLLFFIGTYQWGSESRYLTFFLPSHKLQISTPSGDAPAGMAVLWFNTSLGDVSHEAIDFSGWKSNGVELTLEDPASNMLSWTGKTGETVQIILRGPSQGNKVAVSWDGDETILELPRGKYVYTRSFDVPLYASRTTVVVLGIINFAVLGLALSLLILQKRQTLLQYFSDTLSGGARRLDHVDVLLLAVAAILALLLRALNLENLFPAVDEYYHLIAARQILEGAALSSVYQRSLWVVTLPIALAFRVFGYELWAARLVGVLFNVIAVLPLYFLMRRINRPVAFLSCLLYAASPWIITFARLAREYAYYPFYFFWIIYGMVLFIDRFPDRFIIFRDWRMLLRPNIGLLAVGLMLPPFFALFADRLSTFKVILIAYLVFGVFVLLKFDRRDIGNLIFLLLLGSGLSAEGYIWSKHHPALISAFPRLNPFPATYFFPNPQQQWYFERSAIIPALGLLAAMIVSFLMRHVNFILSFLFALYVSFLAFFVFFSKSFYHTRHLSSTELWYILILAIGLYIVWGVLYTLFPSRYRAVHVFSVILLGFLVFNVQQILLPAVSKNPDMPISEDYFHDMSAVDAFMHGHAKADDVLISTVYGLYTSWKGEPGFQAIYRINTKTPKEFVFSIVDQHQSGWIVIDQIRLDLGSITFKELSTTEGIEYIGSFGDEYVWRWQNASHGFSATGTFGVMR